MCIIKSNNITTMIIKILKKIYSLCNQGRLADWQTTCNNDSSPDYSFKLKYFLVCVLGFLKFELATFLTL